MLRTGEAFLTEKQQKRLDAVFADPSHADVWRAWRMSQQFEAAYRENYPGLGRHRSLGVVDAVKRTKPA